MPGRVSVCHSEMGFRGGRGAPRGSGTPRGRGRGRGSFRGRNRGRGRPAGPRDHGHKTRDWAGGEQFGAYKARETEEPVVEDDVESEDGFDLASAAPMAYSALLTLMKTDDDENTRPRKKKRRTQDVQVEDLESRADIAENSEAEDLEIENEDSIPGDEDDASDSVPHSRDPFEGHFADPEATILEALYQAAGDNSWDQEVVSTADGNKSVLQYPRGGAQLSKDDQVVDPIDQKTWHIKQRLALSAAKSISSLPSKLNDRSRLFLSQALAYRDISQLNCRHEDLVHFRSVYCLHVLNHVFKTRDRILKNNAKLSAHPDADVEYRDQGFTRPKVLIVLPTRNACLEVVNELIHLSGAEQIENRKRFSEQFGTEGIDPLKNANKPEDFKALFAGNTDDAFRIGLKFTRKTIKLFSQFYGSDIIIASPLGLRMAIGDTNSKNRDWDYLSSVEVVIVDGANAMAMQNWEHVEYCFEYLNMLPKESHGCDYGRVRNWVLEEKSKYLRQTVFLSEYEFPELRSLFAGLKNVAGKVRTRENYDGAITDIGISIRQVFQKFESATPSDDPDARFDFFNSTLLPRIRKLSQVGGDAGHGTLLVVPSYFDFVRVRNQLSSIELSFEAISEYSSTSDLTRSRQIFASGRSPVLVITERLHHYRRYEFKGVKNAFFYQLPEHAKYFTELVRCAAAPGQSKADGEIRIAFSKWDSARLERVVGSKRVGKMLSGKDSIFEFV